MKRSFADILGDVAALQRKKVEAKLPGWADVDGLEFPDALCLEQCSGTAAALHKASFIPEGCRIADLTGGLGVDSWAFSRRASAGGTSRSASPSSSWVTWRKASAPACMEARLAKSVSRQRQVRSGSRLSRGT